MIAEYKFDLQPILRNELLFIEPLKLLDFDDLFAVASDPLLWEQHPEKLRFQPDVFRLFFDVAMDSGGAFIIRNAVDGSAIGSSRYYDLNKEQQSVKIGYTFLARKCWGGLYNNSLKTLMMDHAFRFVELVIFDIDSHNLRSQKGTEKIGGKRIGEETILQQGKQSRLNYAYGVEKENWMTRNS